MIYACWWAVSYYMVDKEHAYSYRSWWISQILIIVNQ